MTLPQPRQILRWALLSGALFLGYALLGKLPALIFSGVSPFWPPAALAVFAALVWGWRAMPAIFLGSLWVNVTLFDWSLAGALWVSLGNVLAPMVANWGLRRSTEVKPQFWNSPAGVIWFLLWMGAVQGLLSGLIGAVGLVAFEGQGMERLLPTCLGWAIGDASAALMLAPVAHLLWLRRGTGTGWWRLLLHAEGLAALAFSLMVWGVAFFAPSLSLPARLGVLGMLLLPPIWSVFRLDQWLTLLHLAVAFILVLGATMAGYGPYAGLPMTEAVIGVELLGMAMSAAILFAGALQSQRQEAMTALRALNRDLESRAQERAQALFRKEHNFRDMIERLPAPIVMTSPDAAQVLYANPAARELFARGQTDQSDKADLSALAQWLDPDMRQLLLGEVRQHHTAQNREIAFRRRDGTVVWVLASVIQTQFDEADALLFAFKDISERIQREVLLQAQALTDALTGVPNRRHFMAQAAARLRELVAQQKAAALVLFDLDDFKLVNDTRGHACGDQVLQQVASLLQAKVRSQDVFARLGGEEFCLLLTDLDANQALQRAEELRLEIDGQVTQCPDGQALPLPTSSIGVAWCPAAALQGVDDETRLAVLTDCADTALYAAKAQGKNRCVLFDGPLPTTDAAPAAPRHGVPRANAQALLPLSLLRSLAREVHFGRFFERAAQAAAHLVGADGAAFIERDDDSLSYRFFHGLPDAYQQRFAAYRFPVEAGSAGQAIREGREIFQPDYASDPQALPDFVDSGLKANYLVPVRAGSQTLAILALAWFSRHPAYAPDAQQAENVRLLADLMAGALRRERLERKLRQRATRDVLTQLPNRAALELHLSRAISRARRQQQILAVGMLDLDDFKPVNDQWGHAAGDALLRDFAQRIQQALRDTDFIGRLGGDEFVLVLENLTQQADLDTVLSRLHEVVQAPFDLPDGQRASVGLSLGLALYPQDAADADALIRAADAALYACKSNKSGRARWWLLYDELGQHPGQAPADAIWTEVASGAVLPYGPEAGRLLGLLQPQVSAFAAGFVQRFYADMAQQPDMQAVLQTLSESELAHLQQMQQTHLLSFFSADLEEASHREDARKLGRVHALTGVSTTALVDAFEMYLQQAMTLIQHSPLREADRLALQRIATSRLRVELRAQAQGEQTVQEHYATSVQSLWRSPQGFTNRIDFLRWLLDELTHLPGMVAAAFGRPDEQGRMVVEFSTPRFETYVAHFRRHQQDYLPGVADSDRLAQASQSRAWRSERIETVFSFARDARAEPWRAAAQEAGFRSAASIPLRDGEDRMVAILSVYGAYPNQFESHWIQRHLTLLGQAVGQALAVMRQAPRQVLSDQQRRQWRARLTPEGLHMWVQPVIDLRQGCITRVEALARLRAPDGQWAMPAAFLPWFGASEITRLFTLGLDKALQHLRAWEAQGMRTGLSINLAPEVLLQPDCARWITQALERAVVQPGRLHLELLESADFPDPQARDAAVRALSDLGVHLEMDDLGSGYSSLLRLRSLPFQTVKIDQGLVREAEKEPRRVIGFIGSLIRLAHTLELDVVVEGLESPGLIEVAAILGADQGQGFALAHPMPADGLAEWSKTFALSIDPSQPQTVLGALAAHWRWEYGERDAHITVAAPAHEQCVLGGYLRRKGFVDSEIGRLHAQLHVLAREQDIHSPQYRAATDRMVDLLMKAEHEPQRP